MKNTFKGFSLVFVAMLLVFSIQGLSRANINEVGQSLKKDTFSSKATNEVGIKNKIAGVKSNTKAIKQPAKTISKIKAKTPEVKATINEIFKKSATSKDLFFKKLFSKYLKNKPIVKIDKASQSFKTLETNFNNKKLNQPKVTAPLRIGQRAPVEGITPIGDFPNFEANPNDTLEIEGVQDVNDVYNNSDYFFSGTFYDALIKINSFESVLPSFCEKYSKYPHICALLKFYCAEIRALIFSAPQYGVYYDGYKFQELYTQIDETYSKETGPKEALFKKLSEVCKERINYIASDINTGLGPKISENEAILSFHLDVIKKLKENNGVVDVVYNANGEGINFYRIGGLKLSSFSTGIYDYILLIYSTIIKDYCAMRKFDEANKVLEAFNTFYLNEYPAKIKYNIIGIDENGSEHQSGTENYIIKRDTTTYSDLLKKYMDWNSQYGEIAQNGDFFQNKVAEIIENVNNYQFDESKDNISLQEFDNIKTKFTNKSDEGNDGYYSNKPTITDLYFTKTEYIELQQNEVADPFMTLCLRAQINSSKTAPLYAVKVKVNSSISGHERGLNLKRDFISGSYFCAFQANSREPGNITDNLIDIDSRQTNPEPLPDYNDDPPSTASEPPSNSLANAFKTKSIPSQLRSASERSARAEDIKETSISAAQCKIGGSGLDLSVPPAIYKKTKFFNKLLTRAYIEQKTYDVEKNLCPVTNEFIKSGGGEYITPKMENSDDVYLNKRSGLVKRVANWFIIQGHGSNKPDDDTIGTIAGAKPEISVKPSDLWDSVTTSSGTNFEISNYSGMDVLLIDACHVFSNQRYKKWRKVLPKGVILSYHDQVYFKAMDMVIDKLFETLKEKPKITQEELVKVWQVINDDVVKNHPFKVNLYPPWSYGYIIPSSKPNKNIYYSWSLVSKIEI